VDLGGWLDRDKFPVLACNDGDDDVDDVGDVGGDDGGCRVCS